LKSSRFTSKAAFVKHIIRLYFLKSAEKRKHKKQVYLPATEEEAESKATSVYLPVFLWKGLTDRAKFYGFKPTVYIRNLIAANLTHQPLLTEEQIIELRAANRELASIGRNLNQIAKAINQAVDLKVRDRVNYDHIVELHEGIEKQKAAIYKIVAQSNNVWRVE
jgi:hypothetical protein